VLQQGELGSLVGLEVLSRPPPSSGPGSELPILMSWFASSLCVVASDQYSLHGSSSAGKTAAAAGDGDDGKSTRSLAY
jgi:hypothetical protein